MEKLLVAAAGRMMKLSIHPYTPVLSTGYDANTTRSCRYRVDTEKGTIRSRAVFHATNGYCNHLLPVLRDPLVGVYGCKAHMLAVQPNVAHTGPEDHTMKHGLGYQDFMHWILQRPNEGPFLYGLAEVETTGDYDDSVTIPDEHASKTKMLRFLEQMWPQKFSNLTTSKDIVYDWTGIQGFTADGASIVGRPNIDSPGEFCSVGHNGEGMGRCFLAATVVTEAMLAQMEGREWEAPAWFPQSYARNLNIEAARVQR